MHSLPLASLPSLGEEALIFINAWSIDQNHLFVSSNSTSFDPVNQYVKDFCPPCRASLHSSHLPIVTRRDRSRGQPIFHNPALKGRQSILTNNMYRMCDQSDAFRCFCSFIKEHLNKPYKRVWTYFRLSIQNASPLVLVMTSCCTVLYRTLKMPCSYHGFCMHPHLPLHRDETLLHLALTHN